MAYNAVQDGAAGVDMGRNIFQSENPVAMLKAVRKIVHDGEKPRAAFDYLKGLLAGKKKRKK
jgi:putative autoinducer-2 (AI-2) aldolase